MPNYILPDVFLQLKDMLDMQTRKKDTNSGGSAAMVQPGVEVPTERGTPRELVETANPWYVLRTMTSSLFPVVLTVQ